MARRGWLAVAVCVAAAAAVGVVWVVGSTPPVEPLPAAEQARVREPFDRGEREATNSIGMRLRLIPAGQFVMGTAEGYEDEMPPHRVTVGEAFYLGVHEVTQAQYARVMGSNPSHFVGGRRPVENVAWQEAVEFCRRLSRREGVAYRLPTEAEWEYACRAGTTTKYSCGDSPAALHEHAWYLRTSGRQTHEVGSRKPNAWGLHDMHGNVWEWCRDRFGPYAEGGGASVEGAGRVLRGGAWGVTRDGCRSSYRNHSSPEVRHYTIGFRVARPAGGGVGS